MDSDDASRPLVDNPVSLCYLIPELSSLSPNVEVFDSYSKQIDELVPRVKDMIVHTTSPVEKVMLIDLLCLLGISYHFESEIDNQLHHIFTSNSVDYKEYDLYTVAILFRVFRQHGYKLSCGVFSKFKNGDGEFKKFMETDVKGLLSLYEAAHLLMHGENILEDAIVYTRKYLKSLQSKCDKRLASQIAYALQQPRHRGIEIFEARRFISFYEEDEFCDKTLLYFAKLNFNRLQLLYQQEWNELSRWRSDLNFEKHFFYARDRLAESYMWSLGTYFEPQYGRARIFFTKYIQMFAFTDDTYDAFGKIDELRLLTKAIRRWDIEAAEQVPENMKVLYMSLLDIYHDMEGKLKTEERSQYLTYLKDAVIQAIEHYHTEAEWLYIGYQPSFEEYIETALMSTCYHAIAVQSLIGMGETVGLEEFEWLQKIPKISRASMIICRVMDDLVPREHELTSSHISNGVEIYMKQYGMCKEDIQEGFRRKIEDAWKDINEECTKPTSVRMEVLSRIRNLSRVMDVFYKYKDTFTDPSAMKDVVKSVLVDAIQMK